MNQWINYHHLFYFKTIVEEGSVSKAATKLLIGQPTLSAQLKQFEDNMGITLFERKHKRLLLTEQGKVAYDYASSIFKMGSEMYEVLHDRLKPLRPTLHVGCLDSIPKRITATLAKQALRISPCQITLLEGKSDELIRELGAHRIDLVLTNFLPVASESKGFFPRQISKENISFFGSPKFKHLKKGFPQSISGQPVILPTYDSKLRYDIDHWAKLNKIELNIIIEGQEIAVKKLVASEGIGLMPTAFYSVKRQVDAGELIEIGTMKGVYEEIYLISAQRKIPNPIAAKLMTEFKG